MAKIKTVQRCAICLRISIFVLNAFVWLGSLFAIVCGLMVGFSNGTFSLDAEEDDDYMGGEIRWRDALFTTPATLLIYYGVIMLTTAIIGCFAGSGGRRCCNITFVISIILVLLFDILLSYLFFWNPFAMANFLKNLHKSMNSYGVKNSDLFGIIPHHPTKYWDHLQRTGSCCGVFAIEDWRNTTIASEKYAFSLPDSCCTKDSDYKSCGWRIWKHMEGDMDHYRSQMLKKLGCMSIFPEEVTTKYEEIAYIVIILGIFMVICAICAIVLLVLICTKKYKAGQGPQVLPRFARTSHGPETARPLDYSINSENDSRYRDVEFSGGESPATGRAGRRVHPLNEDYSDEEIPPPRPILKPQAVRHRGNSSTQHIFRNDDFGANSEIEELPVVYRGRAETRIRDPEEPTIDRGRLSR